MSSNRLFKRNTLSAAIAASLLASGQVAIAQEQAGEAEEGMLLEEVVVTDRVDARGTGRDYR